MSAMPWEPVTFELSDAPTDQELRRAFRVLLTGGALGGDRRWSIACARALNSLGPDPDGNGIDRAAYERAAALAPPPARPSGVLGRAGRRGKQLRPEPKFPAGRVGDVVPPDATDDEIQQMYAPGDAAAIIKFRRQLEDLRG